jgi:protein-disulfide isomerase
MSPTVLRIRILLSASLAALAVAACSADTYRSAAAEVSGTDLRRLPPGRAEETPDVMIAAADRGRVIGSNSARVKLFVVSDYGCAQCRAWFDSTLPAIRREYLDAGTVKLAWTSYPLQAAPGAVRAASGAMCASVQGDFWGASERLFASQARWSGATIDTVTIDSIARGSRVDPYTFKLCQEGKRLHRLIRADIDFVDTLHAGAPLTLIVGKRVLPAGTSLATLRTALDSALAAR